MAGFENDDVQTYLTIFLIVWVIYMFLAPKKKKTYTKKEGYSTHGGRSQFQDEAIENNSGKANQPHPTDEVVLIPAQLGIADIYPTQPGNSPRPYQFQCPQGYVKNTDKKQNIDFDKACVYERAIGMKSDNIGGYPFFHNDTVYRCPTGQKRTLKGIESPDACTGDAGFNFSQKIGPSFAKMIKGDRFILANRH